MARKKTSSRNSGSARRGGTLFGLMTGVVLGLLAAAAVAVYMSGVPMPFVDRASRGPDLVPAQTQGLPDPNLGLSSAGIRPPPGLAPPSAGPNGSAILSTPGATPSGQEAPAEDALGALVASLNRDPAAATSGSAADRPAPIPTAPAGRYVLQVGAFRVLEDAEALKAQLALLGFSARVQQATVNGILVNRVQVGPYATVDDMNTARERLAANQVESTIVRQ